MDATTTALAQLAIIIITGVVAAFIAVKLQLPLILGYLIGGIILSLAVSNGLQSQTIQNIAQLGAAMLLFMVGVEFSMENLRRVARIALPGVIIQTLVVIFAAVIVLPLLGMKTYDALFVGVLAATSSTVFVIKMLESREELNTVAGRIMIGWLVLQDVLSVILFLVLTTYAPNSTSAPDLILTLIKAVIVIGVTYGIGQYLLPSLMRMIARTGSDELLIVSVVGIIAVFAVFATVFNVPFTIGAFLAGLALSESFLNHEIFTEVKPLRNLFTMIFFVSVGAIFDLTSVLNNVLLLLAILLILLTLKVAVTVTINVLFKVHIKNALLVGFGISQIGEFAFLGAQLGLSSGWIDRGLYSLIIAATIISMAATPFLYANVGWFYKLLAKNFKNYSPNLYRKLFLNSADDEVYQGDLLQDHIILCGYGRVGSYVAKALRTSDIPFVLIELDLNLAEEAQKQGIDVVFGDASRTEILTEAGVGTAKAIVVALPDQENIDSAVALAKQLNPDIHIVARIGATYIHNGDIDHAIEPEFEAAVSIITALYRIIHRRHKRVVETVRELRQEQLVK